MSKYTIVERGQLYTKDYRCYFKNASTNEYISPFHDIPIFFDAEKKVLNAVIEVPRWSNAKMEISKTEKLNPIMHDLEKSQIRFVANIFPHHGYNWNYGFIPQTWDNPAIKCKFSGLNGDNEALDICEIGSAVQPTGTVLQIKVLGAIGQRCIFAKYLYLV